MTFHLNETYFTEKLAIWRYLTSKLSKKCPKWGLCFWSFLRLCVLRWAWCLFVFLRFDVPVNVFLFRVGLARNYVHYYYKISSKWKKIKQIWSKSEPLTSTFAEVLTPPPPAILRLFIISQFLKILRHCATDCSCP